MKKFKTHNLATNWSLDAHPAFKVYSNENSYVVVDEDSDVVLGFTIDDMVLSVTRCSWNVCYNVNIDSRTIVITTNPEEDE